jgi:predicted nucleic acid-binding protein
MAIGDVEPTFVDTNILVFASERRAPLHAVALQAMRDVRTSGSPIWVSRQILREYVAVLSRPQIWGIPQPIATLVGEVRWFERRFRVAEDNPRVTVHLLRLLQEIPAAGKQVHDANIVATMQTYGIPRLLTHNDADFARYAGIITVVPLGAVR